MSTPKYKWTPGELPPPLDAHSAAKHEILRRYVTTYVEVLTVNPRRETLKLSLVDGFCGGGEYTRGGIIVPGSPLILLDEVAAVEAAVNSRRTKPFKLLADFTFIDDKKPCIDYLRATLQNSAHKSLLGDRVNVVHSTFENALPTVLDRIKSRGRSQRAIFVLDQYGYSDVSLATIRTILASIDNPEIILTFTVDWIVNYLSREEKFLKGIVPVELTLANVQNMLTMKDQRGARWLIQNFLYRHLVEKTGAPYYTPFFIKSPESHRSYWLIHISKHPTARDEMARLHWNMQNHFVHHGRAGLRMLGFDPEQSPDQILFDFVFDDNARARSITALADELPRQIFGAHRNGEAPPTLIGLFNGVCNDTPATKELIGDALLTLRAENEIEILTAEGRSRPRTMTIDDTDLLVPAKERSMFSRIVY